jgi:hypothetical protein
MTRVDPLEKLMGGDDKEVFTCFAPLETPQWVGGSSGTRFCVAKGEVDPSEKQLGCGE